MKTTQAWGWLAAGVLAAALNAGYHDGGLEWAHRIADRAQHVSAAVADLANGRADQFLAEVSLMRARDSMTALSDSALANAQDEMARAQAVYARTEAFSAREQARCARIQAERARIEARMADRRLCIRTMVRVNPVAFRSIQIPQISIPRIEIPQ